MSTTWVFIGLLAGRELGMSIMKTGTHTVLGGLKLALKDVTYALIGLTVSIRGNDGFRRFSLFLEGHSKFEEMMIQGNYGFPLRRKRSKIKICLNIGKHMNSLNKNIMNVGKS